MQEIITKDKLSKLFAAFLGLCEIEVGLLGESLCYLFFFQMLMSAMMLAMTVTRKPPVKTPLGTLHAIAKTDTEEMDATVKVEIN